MLLFSVFLSAVDIKSKEKAALVSEFSCFFGSFVFASYKNVRAPFCSEGFINA